MGAIAQIVRIDPDNILMLFGFNEKSELIFRSSRMPNYRQNEPVKINAGMCYTNLYHFPAAYLAYLSQLEIIEP